MNVLCSLMLTNASSRPAERATKPIGMWKTSVQTRIAATRTRVKSWCPLGRPVRGVSSPAYSLACLSRSLPSRANSAMVRAERMKLSAKLAVNNPPCEMGEPFFSAMSCIRTPATDSGENPPAWAPLITNC